MRTQTIKLSFIILISFVITILLFRVNYAAAAFFTAALSCVPFFIHFESKSISAKEISLVSIMTVLSVLSRIIFSEVPSFKPVTAMIIITAISFGAEAGFMTGSLSAFISNIYFGQGPWTPFQMLAWGISGLLAGLLAKTGIMKNKLVLYAYGAVSGVLFSFLMDIWTVFSIEEAFSLSRYLALVVISLPYTAVYAVSNVVFLAFLEEPIGSKLQRIKTKYGLFR